DDAGSVDVDAGPDVHADPRAPARFVRKLHVGGSGDDANNGAAFVDDTIIVTARVQDTGDVVVGEGGDALAVDSTRGAVVAGFGTDGHPRWAVPASTAAAISDDGLLLAVGPWDGGGAPAPNDFFIGRIDSSGALVWALPFANGVFFAGSRI